MNLNCDISSISSSYLVSLVFFDLWMSFGGKIYENRQRGSDNLKIVPTEGEIEYFLKKTVTLTHVEKTNATWVFQPTIAIQD